MKKIFLLFALLSNLMGFAQSPNLVIHARITDLKADSMVYWRKIDGTGKDSVKTEKGGFTIRTFIPEGEGNLYLVQIGTDRAENSTLLLYLERGKVEIRGKGPMFREAALSGSSFIRDFNAYNQFMKQDPLVAGANELYKKANELYKNKDSIGLAKLQPQLEKTDSVSTVLSKDWVEQHPSTPISAYVLYFRLRRSMSFGELETALDKLSPAAKNNRLAKEIARSIAVNKLTGIGQTALDFTQDDTAGRPVSLKDFRGKYVLVDFWASWCHPCRMENPNVVKAFADYKDKNFTVLGVSLDRPGKKADWLKAIHDDRLSWTQVSDLQFWNNAVARQYDIEAIPSNLLIGPDGKIVAKDLHGDELEKKLAELLGTAALAPGKGNDQFVLQGQISGTRDRWLYLYYTGEDHKRMTDSCLSKEGRFVFKGHIEEPAFAFLEWKVDSAGKTAGIRERQEANTFTCFIEPAVMDISLTPDDFAHARLTGSASQDEYIALEDSKKPVEAQYRNQLDSLRREKDHEKAAAIRERLAPYFAAMRQKDYDFFDAHPQSYVTASMLRFHVGDLSLDSLQLFYGRLGEKCRQSADGRDLAAEIAKLKAGSPGSVARDFTTHDINGQPISLSGFKGHAYVLIDFWASWCVPCRHSNPHMIELFHRYHDKGLDVIGVADDDNRPAAWKAAVEKDGVGIWHNVLRGLDWDKLRKGEPNDKDISEKFGIHSLPTKILIDKDDIIIGRYGEGRDDEAALDKKLAEIFR